MTTTINASTSTGLVNTADTSGIIKLQSNGVTTNALAWVSFVGSTASINASYNVSSVTRSAAGVYLIVFSNATTNLNYTPFISASPSSASGARIIPLAYCAANGLTVVAPTTASYQFITANYPNAGVNYDPDYVMTGVFGN